MITKIGHVLWREDRRVFGIKDPDRLMHMYIIGKTGVGKSSLLKFMALQDFNLEKGFCLMDPHGDLVDEVREKIQDRPHIYLDLSDPNCLLGYNPFGSVKKDGISLAVSGFLDVMKNAWPDAWGVRMEHILRNALFALLEIAGSDISDILKLLGSKDYREKVGKQIENQQVKNFWLHEYDGYSPGYRQEGAAAIQNKIGALLADPLLRRVLTEKENNIQLRAVMDEGTVLLVNLGKGRIGGDSANLFGGLLLTSLGLAAFSRADVPEETRRPYFLYVDEFQNFTTLSLVSMLSELRKYKLGLILSHQYVHQLRPEIRHAIFGNVGTLLSFRVGGEDVEFIARELFDMIPVESLLRLPNYDFYLKLLIDGVPSRPFSGKTAISK